MLWNYIPFYKYTILWICDQIKYVILYKKRHVCVFSHPLVLWSSSERRVQGCVLAVWPTPSFSPLCLRLILHGCVSCSDSRFSDARFLGDWNSAPSPSTSSPLFPWERGSSLARLLQPPPCGVSESCLGLLGSLEVQTGSDRAVGKGWWGPGCWGSSAAPHLWASCPSGATFPSVPAVLSASSSQWVWWLSHATSWETQLPSPGP